MIIIQGTIRTLEMKCRTYCPYFLERWQEQQVVWQINFPVWKCKKKKNKTFGLTKQQMSEKKTFCTHNNQRVELFSDERCDHE